MSPTQEGDWRQQSHEDLGALHARVTSTEQSIAAVGRRLDEWGRDTTQQFAAVTRSIGEVSDKLSLKIDSVNSNSLTARSTNWGTIGTIGGVVLAFSGTVFSFIMADMRDISSHLEKVTDGVATRMERLQDTSVKRDEFKIVTDRTDAWLVSQRDRLRSDEDNAVSQRQIAELKDRFDERYRITTEEDRIKFARLEARTDAIDATLVKRPEIEASNRAQDERITTLSTRMNAIQAQVDSFFPASKVIDEIWSGLREVRSTGGAGKAAPP